MYKKSPQIVGLRPPMCSLANLFAVNFKANQLNIFCCIFCNRLHDAYQINVLLHQLPFGCNL